VCDRAVDARARASERAERAIASDSERADERSWEFLGLLRERRPGVARLTPVAQVSSSPHHRDFTTEPLAVRASVALRNALWQEPSPESVDPLGPRNPEEVADP
jgi:hypothetical protein